MERMRLNKYLAHCGVCSRRDADRLIEQGVVFINGQKASKGQSVSPEVEVTVSGRAVTLPHKTVVLAFYKPLGVTCTAGDSHAKKIISDIVRYPIRVTYAGRLDRDSEGLLLLTNDGDLIQAMMRGENRHEKEYLVKVDKEITCDFLTKMTCGIYLKELGTTTRECEIQQIGEFIFRITLTQGLNRQIRRMCEACGYRAKNIKRVRVMHVPLGKLKPGEFLELPVEDVRRLYDDCGIRQPENLI